MVYFALVTLTISILASFIALVSCASTLHGKVVRVADGDTITVLADGNVQNKIRLNRIDAPEKKQAYGEASRKCLAGMVAGKVVQVRWEKKDRYGRILGDVFIGDVNVNLQMVQSGLAWHYKNYDDTEAFAVAEREAREKKVGLWKESDPTAPWEFRKQRMKKDTR